jgi:hypothetical protein
MSYPERESSITEKVHAILAFILPQNVKQLCRFLGMVQYYRDIWAQPIWLISADTPRSQRPTKLKRGCGIGILSIRMYLTM